VDNRRFPNIIIWSWMRTILDLCGTELFIFAYMFSQAFDSAHRCYAKLSDMEDWFGVTRQTISRTIDRLVSRGLIIKECNREETGFLKHNNYAINTKNVIDLCEKADQDNYFNFIESYSHILKERFPADSIRIDGYMQSLLQWHMNKDIEIRVTLNEIAAFLSNGDCGNSLQDLIDAINASRPNTHNAHSEKQKNPKQSKKDSEDVLFQTKASRSKKRPNKAAEKREITHEFVCINAGGSQELTDILMQFLDTQSGKAFSPEQWRQQLNVLYNGCRSVDKMIQSVQTSYTNNYRALYYEDKTSIDMQKKYALIDDYIESECDGNDTLRGLLHLYIEETPKGKSYTEGQFRLALKTLSELCKTVQQKIASVEKSYANSYSALAYPTVAEQTDQDVDKEEKVSAIHDFIKGGYYHLVDGLESALISYISSCRAGKTMSVDMFKIALDNLRLLCFNDDEKVSRVRLAIQNNSSRFATEDYSETQRLKAKCVTRTKKADELDRARKQKVIEYKRRHMNDDRVKDVIIPTYTGEFI